MRSVKQESGALGWILYPADEPARLRFGEPTVKDFRRQPSRILNDDSDGHGYGSAVESFLPLSAYAFSPERYTAPRTKTRNQAYEWQGGGQSLLLNPT